MSYRYRIDFTRPGGYGLATITVPRPIASDADILSIRDKLADENGWPRDGVDITNHQPLDN